METASPGIAVTCLVSCVVVTQASIGVSVSSGSPASFMEGIVKVTMAFSLPIGAAVAARSDTATGTVVWRPSVSTVKSRRKRWKAFFFDVARTAR